MKDVHTLTQGVIRAAIDSVRPENFIAENIRLTGSSLTIREKSFDLGSYDHIYVISVGEAAYGMAEALYKIIGQYVCKGIVLAKHLPRLNTLPAVYRLMQV